MSTAIDVPPELLPSRKFLKNLGVFGGIFGFLVGAFIYQGTNPFMFFTEFHHVVNLFKDMVPLNVDLFSSEKLWASMIQTISMAFLGTFGGGFLAFIMAFFAARNTAPNAFTRGLFRAFLAIQRVAPDYAIMLVIITTVGFGPFAGTIALIIGSTGMFGKFFADAIENVNPKPQESVRVLGASKTQEIRYGIVPLVLPSFVANGFFLLEINVGAAIALGVYGGGGLGFHLNVAGDTLQYQDLLAYVVFILVMMICIERVSDRFRKRIFNKGITLK
ncbi:MAG: ABC transporter permease subunit [Opitutales bacterium]|nr:ABC transporter permease subunit [Opitutales bacterium]NRA28377.1 ABC transporter permease subunit [Opitutales bacterium]